jgi:RNA-binding protein YlmH
MTEVQRKLHRLCDIIVALTRAELMATDEKMRLTMRGLRKVARGKIRVIEKQIATEKRLRTKRRSTNGGQ